MCHVQLNQRLKNNDFSVLSQNDWSEEQLDPTHSIKFNYFDDDRAVMKYEWNQRIFIEFEIESDFCK